MRNIFRVYPDKLIAIENITPEAASLEIIRQLFLAYQLELGADLCFQNFEKELANPFIKYGPPNGALLLATYNEEIVGCVALQPLEEAGVCEMKRLYVKPAFRQYKIGKALVEAIIAKAIDMEYKLMKLDTLSKLKPAIALYLQNGFEETTAYYSNPLENVVYMQKQLQQV